MPVESPSWERRCFLRPRFYQILLITTLWTLSACASEPTVDPTEPIPTPTTQRSTPILPTQDQAPDEVSVEESQPIVGGPVLLRSDLSLRKVLDVGGANIRLARNPLDNVLYLLHPGDGLFQLNAAESSSISKIADISDITADGFPTGMAFGPDGTLYVVANKKSSQALTQAVILKGVTMESGDFIWSILAESEPYPLSATPFDHLFNGIVVSPDNQWVYVSSGSRTDHGEVQDNGGEFPEIRETDLTARIFRISTEVSDLVIPDDESDQNDLGLLFAAGTRNAYDLAFGPNGDLFAVDNGPDADYPDELNWIREGAHYGFPWRFGSQDNPQQFAEYDAATDKRLSKDFVAVQLGSYRNDPGFPPSPGSFYDPVVNLGPAAAQYRGDDGNQYDAAVEGKPLHTFTPHRSPLGLVFTSDENMPPDLLGNEESMSAFILSWGSAGGDLSDSGQDLLHLALTKQGDHYESVTTQIARNFKNPIDSAMINNRLYILEYGSDGAIWELTFD